KKDYSEAFSQCMNVYLSLSLYNSEEIVGSFRINKRIYLKFILSNQMNVYIDKYLLHGSESQIIDFLFLILNNKRNLCKLFIKVFNSMNENSKKDEQLISQCTAKAVKNNK